jgi:two-component system nitrogen regulation response regulator NtrX
MERRTLLIVDDEKHLLTTLKAFFELRGYRVWGAVGGEAALQIVRRYQPSVVLLDLRLGDSRLQGLDILQQVKARWPGIAVLMWSGSADAHTKVAALQLGAERFFDKPLSIAEVLQAVQEASKR